VAEVAERGVGSERVPDELVSAFRASHGADVSDVPVHRGEEAARHAQAIQAGAFTSGGEVFLPAEAGPLTEPGARAMLAHELAHVVQQRTLGSSLPDEHSAHGLDLEAQARAHEEWARHGAIGAPPVRLRATPPAGHAPSAPMIHPRVQRTPRATTADAPASPAPTPAPASPPVSAPDASTGSPTSSGSASSSSGTSGGLTGSDAPRLVGGVRLPDDGWTQQHDSTNPRNAGELGNMFAESFGGLVLDEWGIDSSVPGADLERDTRRTQLRTQLLDEINHERVRQHLPLLPELGADELQLVEDQLDHERLSAQGLSGGGRGSGGTGGTTGSTTSGTGSGTATGTGRGSGTGGRDQDDGRIHNFREFGGELALGAIDLLGGGMGIDLTADQENEIRGRPARSTDGTGASGDAHHSASTAHGSAHATGGEHELIEPDRMDLDELAVRIYDRLRTRLRLELLVDRERAGLLSDFR
jgi:hypothetical protein